MPAPHRNSCSPCSEPRPQSSCLVTSAVSGTPDRALVPLDNGAYFGHDALVSDLLPFVVEAAEGVMISSPLAGSMLLKAEAERTGGHFTLLENEVPPKAGPALHRHGNEDEMYYVLEGTFRFKLADRIELAPPGAFVYIPMGTPHCFQNLGDEPGRLLVMFTPSGMERFFRAKAELLPAPMEPGAPRAWASTARWRASGHRSPSATRSDVRDADHPYLPIGTPMQMGRTSPDTALAGHIVSRRADRRR